MPDTSISTIDAEGGINDPVRIVVNGAEILNVESYEFATSVLEVPCSFALRVGHNGVLRDLLAQCPPHAKYQLYVGNILQASGRLDGYSVPSDDGTTLELRGRDNLAPLHDAFVREEKSYESKTYLDIVQIALAEAGVDGHGVVHHDNKANRKARTGVTMAAREPLNVEQIVIEKGKGGAVYKTVTAKLSYRWLDLVRQHLDRAGLFLWATADGDWVLSAPAPDQEPTYSLTLNPELSMTDTGFRGAVRRDRFENGVQPPRYSEVIIYSRTSAKKYGRSKVKGKFVDQELVDLGIDRPLTMRDADVASIEQAERLAARKLAEGRRSTFQLWYTTHGHSAVTPTGARAVWCPDTVVALDDREIGLKGIFYLESCVFRRSEGSGTTTTLKLLRPDDVVFGHTGDG